MNEFQESLNKLKTLYSFGKKISIINSSQRAGTYRMAILEKMIEKILLHNNSILLLLSALSEQPHELDASLIASATRNIMDSANIYFHISQRGLSTDEVEFRAEIMAHNALYNEISITKKLGFSQDCFHASLNLSFYGNPAAKFQKFSQFTNLSANEQAQIVSGRKSTFQMKSPHIFEKQMESAIYNLLSNSVHGLSLGLGSNSINHSLVFNNFFHILHLLIISLQVSRIYTSYVIKDYLNLRKRLYSLLSSDEKKLLKSYMSQKDLQDYINKLRIEYEKDFFQ